MFVLLVQGDCTFFLISFIVHKQAKNNSKWFDPAVVCCKNFEKLDKKSCISVFTIRKRVVQRICNY